MFEHLRDAHPPLADHAVRDAVAGRALRLRRRRHLAQAGGAIVAVTLVSVGSMALLNGGSASSNASHNVATASKHPHGSNVAAPTTTTTMPTDVLGTTETRPPARAPTTTTAPAVRESPAPAAPASASGHLTGHPGFALTSVRITGPGATFDGVVSGDSYSLAGPPTGTYDIYWQAEGPATPAAGGTDLGTAAIAGHATITLTSGSNTVDIS